MSIIPWCTGKEAYGSKAKALSVIKRKHKSKRRTSGWCREVQLLPYRCTSCHQWHIGGTTREAVNESDHFGHTVRKRRTLPKERTDGDTERRAAESREASLSKMWADAEAQKRQKFER